MTASWPAPDIGLVRAVGEIDMLTTLPWARALADTCHQLARHDDDLLRRGAAGSRGAGWSALVCDLTGVEFFGAGGLTVLVRTAALAADTGVALRVIADDRPVLRPLRIAGLDRSLHVGADLFAAITHALRRRRR